MMTHSKTTPATLAQNLIVVVLVMAFVAACATAPRSPDDRSELRRDAESALDSARSEHPGFDSILQRAAGYAVFPEVGKGGAGAGGAYGRGIVYQDGMPIGYTDLTEASFGAQLGGQTYTQILVFETDRALDRFRQGNYELSAQATAVALKSGTSANARFRDGVAVYTMGESGLMAEASVGGQKFSYQPILPATN